MNHKISRISNVKNIQNDLSTDILHFNLQILSKNLAQYFLITFCKASSKHDQFI